MRNDSISLGETKRFVFAILGSRAQGNESCCFGDTRLSKVCVKVTTNWRARSSYEKPWFLDLNYTYAMTEGHTANFASPFIEHSPTSVGTLVGNSAWRAETQRVGLSINKAF
jgi:hypothetical protein